MPLITGRWLIVFFDDTLIRADVFFWRAFTWHYFHIFRLLRSGAVYAVYIIYAMRAAPGSFAFARSYFARWYFTSQRLLMGRRLLRWAAYFAFILFHCIYDISYFSALHWDILLMLEIVIIFLLSPQQSCCQLLFSWDFSIFRCVISFFTFRDDIAEWWTINSRSWYVEFSSFSRAIADAMLSAMLPGDRASWHISYAEPAARRILYIRGLASIARIYTYFYNVMIYEPLDF